MRYGTACNMLRKLKAGDTVFCRIKSGSMEPPKHDQPGKRWPFYFVSIAYSMHSSLNYIFVCFFYAKVCCVGIGSGIAPHMALIRDRVFAATNGLAVEPLSLYFGNRFSNREFLYKSELEQIATEHGDWFTLHTAFSRDVIGKKIYVQDLVAVNEDVREILLERAGLLYD
eukprot:scaffold6654_cov135-Skeletonema_menzelii.AAC.1